MLRHGYANTRSGRHRRMCFILGLCGMLRDGAESGLVVRYRVTENGAGAPPSVTFLPGSDVWLETDPEAGTFIHLDISRDKNLKSGELRHTYIPSTIPGLDLHPVNELLNYLVEMRPPSSGFLLVAAVGNTGFNANEPTTISSAFTEAYTRACGATGASKRVSSHSGRKTMATLLWNAGWCKRVLHDIGHWAIPKTVVDIYFHTARSLILRAMASVGGTAARATRTRN